MCKHLHQSFQRNDMGICKDCGMEINGRAANDKVFGKIPAISRCTYESLGTYEYPTTSGSMAVGSGITMRLR